MIESWQHHLEAQGARIVDGHVSDFGDPQSESRHAAHGPIVADLSQLGLIQFAGDDAQSFLQGQLSNDVRHVDAEHCQFTSYNSPKGRMLANGLLWLSAPQTYVLQLPASLRAATQKRLSMFVMRAKVQVEDIGAQWVQLGVGGSSAAERLATIGALPPAVHGMQRQTWGMLARLPGDSFILWVTPEQAPSVWSSLCAFAKPVGVAGWEALLIRAGIPTLSPATQEQFVAQMLNFELIGGVNFKKGCYPGQEIVARTQYLGKQKRRMYLAHVTSDNAPQPGDELFSADLPDQATGMIVNAAPAIAGGYDVLAVLQISSAENQALHWKSLQGPTLELQTLPYPLP